MSIHNIGYQGVFTASAMYDLNIDDVIAHIRPEDRQNGQINWLKEGIYHADIVSTVSPTYAREICEPLGGHGLDATLRARNDEIVGILNGVDYQSWDPEIDPLLPARYSVNSLAGKTQCKRALLSLGQLELNLERPVIGMVSRLAHQKGFDLLMGSLDSLLGSRDFTLCILASGDPRYVEFFNALMGKFPERVYFHNGYDESLAHLIEAGSDIFLMPSLYEPCGLNQMYSLKYGTVPIVRKTGGLADSVKMWDGSHGTGIVFNDYDSPAVQWAVNTALDLYKNPETWHQLIRNGMMQDFSWQQQVLEYERLYQRLL
jgi:starch synthase